MRQVPSWNTPVGTLSSLRGSLVLVQLQTDPGRRLQTSVARSRYRGGEGLEKPGHVARNLNGLPEILKAELIYTLCMRPEKQTNTLFYFIHGFQKKLTTSQVSKGSKNGLECEGGVPSMALRVLGLSFKQCDWAS